MTTAVASYPTKGARADRTIDRAMQILESRLRSPGTALGNPQLVRKFLALRLARLEHEVFMALWLDTQSRLIEADELFRGTLMQTSVYPREVVKRALQLNAGAVIFAHNHPSGCAEPSNADQILTAALKQALALIDVRMLDHFVVGGIHATSTAELEQLRLVPPQPVRKPRQRKPKN
jgi:DNA repair protein RadC